MFVLKLALSLFALLFLLPLGIATLLYQRTGIGADWWSADRSSIGHLPPATQAPEAVVRVFAAPTVRWRGIFAVHCWIVLKPAGAAAYTRYDYTAWGDPIRVNGFAPDGRWFGRHPELVFAADGAAAAGMIPRMQAAIEGYTWRNRGDYRAWPGPISTPSSPPRWPRCRRPRCRCRRPPSARTSRMTGAGCAAPPRAPV